MEPVLQEKIKTELLLKIRIVFYKDITINMENVSDELVCLKKDDEINSNDEDCNIHSIFCQVASESCVASPYFPNEHFETAPEKRKKSENIILSVRKQYEKLAFPNLSSCGKYGK